MQNNPNTRTELPGEKIVQIEDNLANRGKRRQSYSKQTTKANLRGNYSKCKWPAENLPVNYDDHVVISYKASGFVLDWVTKIEINLSKTWKEEFCLK